MEGVFSEVRNAKHLACNRKNTPYGGCAVPYKPRMLPREKGTQATRKKVAASTLAPFVCGRLRDEQSQWRNRLLPPRSSGTGRPVFRLPRGKGEGREEVRLLGCRQEYPKDRGPDAQPPLNETCYWLTTLVANERKKRD